MSLISVTCTKRQPGPFPANRRCTHTDESGVRCITKLCTFDEGPMCFVHSAAESTTAHEQRVSFRDLMSEAA